MLETATAAVPPPRAAATTVRVEENVRIAHDTFRLRFAHAEMAAGVLPGQFFMFRLPHQDDPLLGRPLALYDTVVDDQGQPRGIDVVYLVVGKMTRRLASLGRGDAMEVWGPLGNGFPSTSAHQLIMAAGGIGQTPFLAMARECLGLRSYGVPPRRAHLSRQATLLYGTRSAKYLAGAEDFTSLGVEVLVSTNDGSRGHHGLVTGLMRKILDVEGESSRRIVCCGPEPMMKAAVKMAAEYRVPCEVSLETPMACGLGICFSCVARVREADGTWDYRRTCVEGPVFDGQRIVW